jgi:hypothetical protein
VRSLFASNFSYLCFQRVQNAAIRSASLLTTGIPQSSQYKNTGSSWRTNSLLALLLHLRLPQHAIWQTNTSKVTDEAVLSIRCKYNQTPLHSPNAADKSSPTCSPRSSPEATAVLENHPVVKERSESALRKCYYILLRACRLAFVPELEKTNHLVFKITQ